MKKLLLGLLFFSLCQLSFAQKISIQGRLTDETGEPLIGATIIENGTKNGVVTDIDGRFKLHVADSSAVLMASFVGYSNVTTNVKAFLATKQPLLDIKMTGAATLSEVVVVGYSAVRSKDLTGRVAGISRAESMSKVVRDSKSKATAKAAPMSPPPAPSEHSFVRADKVEVGVPQRATTDFLALCKKLDSPKPVPAPETEEIEYEPSAGQLTASEWNPLTHWAFWNSSVDSTFSEYRKMWRIYTDDRISVQLRGASGQPVAGALVEIEDAKGSILWATYSDNKGQAELFEEFNTKQNLKSAKISVSFQGQKWHFPTRTFDRFSPYTLTVPVACVGQNAVDIAFVVDATGSMGDEIAYLKSELADVIRKVKQDNRAIDLQMGSVFYRDFTDEYVTKITPFSPQMRQTLDFIKKQSANGGGDFPEAVPEGLEAAIDSLQWRSNSIAKLLFLVLDAPPHNTETEIKKMHDLTVKAASKGIRIIPIMASGVDQNTEFLMKSVAVATNGTYIYLTDDSGIGDSHLKATVDEAKVELLNDLLVRVISERVALADCSFANLQTQNGGDAHFGLSVQISPNPARDMLIIELKEGAEEAYISDLSGRVWMHLSLNTEGVFPTDISHLANGLYVLTVKKDKAICSKKFSIMH